MEQDISVIFVMSFGLTRPMLPFLVPHSWQIHPCSLSTAVLAASQRPQRWVLQSGPQHPKSRLHRKTESGSSRGFDAIDSGLPASLRQLGGTHQACDSGNRRSSEVKTWGLGWSPAQTLQELARGAAAGEEGKTWYFGTHLMEQAEVPPIFSNQAAGTYFSPTGRKTFNKHPFTLAQ